MNIFSIKRNKEKKHSGFTLVEMIMYIGIMTIITIALTQSLVIVFKSNRLSFVDANIRNSAYGAMEAMIREIRSSQSVDTVTSVLYPSTNGVLQLNQIDSLGNPFIVKFATSSTGALNISQGSTTPTLLGPITSGGTRVTSLIFNKIDTGHSQAVRIQMQVAATVDGKTRSEWFYSTVILRGSY